ncbi:polyphosphate kinase 1 [Anaeromyxobacter diazotrophicus]|uniref:Polyphosphate kinase n=1 Tax=Anaeromyxobacter diazotrophicus TaxID=2590199 RepID=A0A7I9VTI0_9BACT|nr:polyphosphate kinase 1 [Anaeromyxobacter diazotrophicus]GEJ59460.1 polyphosphate kinase [Anaeromyxobacter diazotrophicus]
MATPQPTPSGSDAPIPPAAEAAAPRQAPAGDLYINRELSWLEFNQRVLDEAADASLPLADQLKFLGIVASNLDEFFMVRVAGLKTQLRSEQEEDEAPRRSWDGLDAAEQLRYVSARAHRMVDDQYRLWREVLRPQLERAKVRIVRPADLNAEQAAGAGRWFQERVLPLLTPLAKDRSHPFPRLRNKAIALAVQLPRAAGRRRRGGASTLAVVGIHGALQRLVPTGDGRTFVLVEDLVREHVSELFFTGAKLRTFAFRVTRNWDLEFDEEEGGELLALVSDRVRRRDRGAAVRLEVEADTPRELVAELAGELRLDAPDIYQVEGPLQLQDMPQLPVPEPERRRPRSQGGYVPPELAEGSIFEAIARRDWLLHHPYDAFDPVVRFIESAAEDPQVQVIKQVLYRTGKESAFVRALQRAAERGKEVEAAVFLEIQARLDETVNIDAVNALKDAGASVVYGYDAKKTHCKISLVVRLENGVPRRYVHVGTGNYNTTTARLYTDVSLLTARPELAEEVAQVFNMLTANTTGELAARGITPQWPWKRLAVAPHGLKERVLRRIEEEVAEAAAGRPARVLAKMNSLVDREVIEALYRASQAGVTVELLVRGICCLRPGVPGISERIRVHQVVDGYLEHSRIFIFGEGKRARYYISSADWMPRNFHTRVEVMAPVDDPEARQRLLQIVEAGLADTVKGRVLRAEMRDRSPVYERPAAGAPFRSQELLERSPARDPAPPPAELRPLPGGAG